MKSLIKFFFFLFAIILAGCTAKKENNMQDQISNELKKIDSLLRDVDYNVSMASVLEKAHYTARNEAAPQFPALNKDTSTITVNVKEEKIATNLSGFYALECGIGFLCAQSGETPVAWVKKIISNTADSNAILLLNRFANATWKAAQPFRDLNRITRPTFTVANFLPQDEIAKDSVQISNSASKLLASMQDVTDSSTDVQMKRIRSLMQNKIFAMEMAEAMHVGYYKGLQQTAPAFLSLQDDTAGTKKSLTAQRVATNVGGFYALECGLNYFAATKQVLPSDMLRSIVNDSLDKDDKILLMRFANATWKAGQPFQGLSKIEKENFVPFYFINETEVDKDMVQIKVAAKKLLSDLK